MLTALPYELVMTDTEGALEAWAELKLAGRGYPVIFGSEKEAMGIVEWRDYPYAPAQPPDQILAEAARIRFPADLEAARREELRVRLATLEKYYTDNPTARPRIEVQEPDGTVRVLSVGEARARMLAPPAPPPDGDWPVRPYVMRTWDGDYPRPGQTKESYIALLPVTDWTAVPAILRWGRWNECPAAAYHVAALRSWRDRFGAELIAVGLTTIDLRIARPPADRDAAIALARELRIYCPDMFRSVSELAASLLVSRWWNFYWD